MGGRSDAIATMKIDAHVHAHTAALDDLGRGGGVLARVDTIERLRPLALTAGVDAVVLVQTVGSERETEGLLALAAGDARGDARGDAGDSTGDARGDSYGFVAGVVGWVDLTRPDAGARLDRLRTGPGGGRLAGIRTMVPDTGGRFPESAVARGMRAVAERGLALDLLLTPSRLPDALVLAEAVPESRIVVDHLAKPETGRSGFAAWSRGMRALARRANVAVKLSGLLTQPRVGHAPDQLRPHVDVALEAFGAERVMLGSDWPLCEAARTYDATLETTIGLVGERAARMRIEGGTAREWYRLGGPDGG
ncbi:amidohydrolase family protein [Humibacter albus]|uniref:amidohydrolase family protein n=1 Tax=Humibacter albus TaxID=427754 RepID=UPI0003F96AC6|nr:amidohydrolase family protein [Humibacter albus]